MLYYQQHWHWRVDSDFLAYYPNGSSKNKIWTKLGLGPNPETLRKVRPYPYFLCWPVFKLLYGEFYWRWVLLSEGGYTAELCWKATQLVHNTEILSHASPVVGNVTSVCVATARYTQENLKQWVLYPTSLQRQLIGHR